MEYKELREDINKLVRNVPDYPKPGIQFKDITPVLADATSLSNSIEWFVNRIQAAGGCDVVAGIESRGFIFAVAIATRLNCGFIPIRKPGKLPWKTHKVEYELEYGTDTLEVHTDAIEKGKRVVIIDDLLATGGTAEAAAQLMKKCEVDLIGTYFLIELDFLKGREKLKEVKNIESLLHY